MAVELAGAVPALAFAYEAARRGGTVVTAGLPHPDARLSLPAVTLTAQEKTLKGSYMGSCVPLRDIPNYAALMRAGKLPIDRLITHRLRLDDINAGFERLAAGGAIRQIVLMDGAPSQGPAGPSDRASEASRVVGSAGPGQGLPAARA